MRLIVQIEPTSYLLPLVREIQARSKVKTQVVFLEENFTQAWNLKLDTLANIEVLKGSRLKKLMRLVELLRQDDLELVHLTGWGHPMLMAGLVIAGMRGLPITMASDTQYDPRGSATRKALKMFILPVIFRGPRVFFPAGTRQAAYFMRYGVKQSRIRIAQMSVDVRTLMAQVDRLRPQRIPVGENGKKLEFLYVGRLEPHKGIYDLIEAFVAVSRSNDNCRLTIVGDGILRPFVQSAAATYPTVHYRGRLSGDALGAAYGTADVFVLPSHVEPWGLVVNEAMAASLAVIATDRVGCVDDLVIQNENGVVVPAMQSDRLAAAMLRFVEAPAIAAEMGRKSRARISNWATEDWARILLHDWDLLKR